MEFSAQQSRREEFYQGAIEFLRNKTPEELIQFQELLLKFELDTSMTGDAFSDGCLKLIEENPSQQLQFGLLLTQHVSPAMRELAYYPLSRLQEQYPEAENALWAMLEDPDREVAASYLRRLEEDCEEISSSFPRVIELVTKIAAVKTRLTAN